MVEIMLWMGLASHLLYWGNKDFLLREFSLEPMHAHKHWEKSMHGRVWLFFVVLVIPLLLPIDFKLKLLLPVLLGARFLYESYDVIILYKKKFITSILFESVGFIVIAGYVLFFRDEATLNRLVAAYTGAEIIKAAGMYIIFHKEFPLKKIGFHSAYYSAALPFFLLGFTGLIQSKVDLMCVTFFLPKDQIAQYQVYVNFLLLVQASSDFLLAPFVKNLYRLKRTSIMKLSARLLVVGIMTAAIAIPTINVIIQVFYHFTLPTMALLTGGLFVIPIFYYSPITYYLLRLREQRSVLIINIIGAVIAFVLNMVLIPTSKNGISGAMDAIAITQWLLLVMSLVINRVKKHPVLA
jgi:O-antigen/teichoic acid export membrane protein